MSTKLAWHFQNVPAWAKVDQGVLINSQWVKLIDPPSQNMFPGCRTIARVYIPDQEAWSLIMMAEAGAEIYYSRCKPVYERAGYVEAWEGPNEPPVDTPLKREMLCRFTQRWAQLMLASNRRTIGLCLSVGWPSFGTARELGPAMLACDYWAVHEYAAPHVLDGDGWLTLRYRKTIQEFQDAGYPIKPLFITELNVDGGVIREPGKSWKTYYGGDRAKFLHDLALYDEEICLDPRVLGAFLFVSGPAVQWIDFDIDQNLSSMLHTYIAESQAPNDPVVAAFNKAFGSRFVDLRTELPRNPNVPWYKIRDLKLVDQIVMHHTAGSSTNLWKDIATWEIKEHNWPSIAYTIGIDEDGTVNLLGDLTELRGATSDPTANLRGIQVVCNGNYSSTKPSDAMLQSLRLVFAVLSDLCAKDLRIAYHRDYENTVCPGIALYDALHPQQKPLPTQETTSDPRILAQKVRWWTEEYVRQLEAGEISYAHDILYALINIRDGLMYRLEHALSL